MALTDLLLFGVIFIVGGITVYTDLKERRIHNLHLLIGALTGGLVLLAAAVVGRESQTVHVVNGLLAAVAGAVLFYAGVWKGGDAKMFALLAFLMPATGYEGRFLSSVVVLFASAFLFGCGLLLPVLITDAVRDRVTLFDPHRVYERFVEMRTSFLATLVISWIFLPFNIFFRASPYSRESYAVIFLTLLLFKELPEVRIHIFEKPVVLLIIFIAGVWERWALGPQFLLWPYLMEYLLRMTVAAIGFFCLRSVMDCQKDFQDRFPFAVLLFSGCLLSYTPFLGWIIRSH